MNTHSRNRGVLKGSWILVLLCFWLASSMAQLPKAGWPTARGNAPGTGQSNGANATSTQLWTFSLYSNLAFQPFQPLIDRDGTIYVHGRVSTSYPGLYALDPKTGTPKWYSPGASSAQAIGINGMIYTMLFVSYDSFTYYTYLIAFDQASAAFRWATYVGPNIGTPLTIGIDGAVYTGFAAYDGQTGALLWNFDHNPNGPINAPAIGTDGTLYAGNSAGNAFAIDHTTGKLLWFVLTGNSVSAAPAVGKDGNVYFTSQDGGLYAINMTTGKTVWTYQTSGPIYGSPAIGPNGNISFYGQNNGTFGEFNINHNNGTLKWFTPASTGLNYAEQDSIVDAVGTVYEFGQAFDGETGALKFSVPGGRMAISDDGTLICENEFSVTAYQSIHVISITLNPNSVLGGNQVTGKVTINAPAPAGGISVSLTSDSSSATLTNLLTIPAGSTSATFNVNTLAVKSQTLAHITATPGLNQIAPLTILPATPSGLSFVPTTVLSGGTSVGTVSLSGPAGTGGATVSLSSDSTSVSVPSSLTIASGQSSGTFTATSSGVDALTVANVTATLAGQSASGSLTVTPSGLTNLSLNPSSVAGGVSSTGTVTLSGPAGPSGVVVSLSSSLNSVTVPGTVTIASGKTSATFTISTSGVSSSTSSTISASSNGITKTATLTITAASITNVVLNPSSVVGGNGSTGTVNLSGQAGPGGAVITLQSGNSAAMIPVSLTIAQGQSSGMFSISTLGVASQTSATITASFGGLSPNAVLTITPATIQSLVLNPTTVVGGNSSTGTVTLTGLAPLGGLSVVLTSSNLAATVPGSLSFPQGTSVGTFVISTSNVSLATTSNISATLGSSSQKATLSLNPTKLQSVSVSPSTVPAGSSSAGTVTLSGAAGATGFVVSLSSSNPSVASVPGSVTVSAGNFSANFSVTTTGVSAQTNVTITATLSGVTQTCVLTVNPATIASVTLNPSSVVGGSNSTGTVNLTGPCGASGLLVSLGSSNGFATVPSSVVIPGGQTSATFTAKTIAVDSVQTPSISASAGGVTQSATLTINPASLQGLRLNPTLVQGGSSSTASVSLTGPAGPSGLTYSVTSSSTSATVPPTVTIAAGQSMTTFMISTTGVNTQTNASISVGSQVSSNLTITPATVSGVAFNPSSMAGGLTSTGTVYLSGPAGQGGTSVSLSSNSTSAVVPSSVIVPAGQTSTAFTVNTSAVA